MTLLSESPLPPRGRIFFLFGAVPWSFEVGREWYSSLKARPQRWNHRVLPPYAPARYVRTSIQSARVSTVPAGRHSATAMGQLDSVAALVVEPLSRRGPPLPPFLFSGLLLLLMQDGRACTRWRNIFGPLSSQSLFPPGRTGPADAKPSYRLTPSPGSGEPAMDGTEEQRDTFDPERRTTGPVPTVLPRSTHYDTTGGDDIWVNSLLSSDNYLLAFWR